MATAFRAMAEVRLAKKLGEKIPENMALDKNGKPTTDPESVNALKSFGGYKGYGLGLAIEILAGSFLGAKMGNKVKDSLDRGYLFLVINPEIFVDSKTFKNQNLDFFNEIKKSRKGRIDADIVFCP